MKETLDRYSFALKFKEIMYIDKADFSVIKYTVMEFGGEDPVKSEVQCDENV